MKLGRYRRQSVEYSLDIGWEVMKEIYKYQIKYIRADVEQIYNKKKGLI